MWDPGREDALKSGAMKALVKATAALSREERLDSANRTRFRTGNVVIKIEESWTVLMRGSCV